MSYSKTITENDLKEVFTQLGLGVSFGQTYEADWTATSTNSTPQRCTDSIYLPKGKYIGVIKLPVTDQESTLFFGINDISVTIGGMVSRYQSSIPVIFEVDTDNRETYVVTGMSTATTYTYTERGYLKVICISDMKQYGTTVLDYYPVGSYYETSDSSFNPNVAWGGTWELVTKYSVVQNSASSVSMAANTENDICTITLKAGGEYILLGSAGTGVGTSNQSTNCSFRLVSGTGTLNSYIVNTNVGSAGATENATGYFKATTDCVVAVTKRNYTSSTITTGNGKLVGIPIKNIDDGKITWHRTA